MSKRWIFLQTPYFIYCWQRQTEVSNEIHGAVCLDTNNATVLSVEYIESVREVVKRVKNLLQQQHYSVVARGI